MKAIISTLQGARITDRPKPVPAAHEICVRVQAIGMNHIDLAALRDPRDQIIGMEWAGEVTDVGSEVRDIQQGDRVMCTGAGGYAEYALADTGRCVKLPDTVPAEQGASMLLGLQTMHDALVTRGGLSVGHTVLIQGASSCMGLIGMQLASALGASTVLGTSRNAGHRSQLGDYGCNVAVDSSQAGWSQAVLDATNGNGANITIDQVSGESINQCLAATTIGGTIVNVGRLGGASAAFDFNLHALRRIAYVGVTFRTRSLDEVRILNEKMMAAAKPLISSLKVPLAARFDFDDFGAALKFLAEPSHMGKVVLVP